MAEIINSMPPRRTYSRYPWHEWLDGAPRKLTRGTDFTVSVPNFRSILITHAGRAGLKAAISVKGDDVYFQVIRDAEA